MLSRFLTIRMRIVALATLIVGVALVVVAVAVVRQQREVLTDNVEQTVRLRAGDIEALLRAGQLPAFVPQDNSEVAAVQVVDSAGAVVAATANLEGLPRLSQGPPIPGSETLQRVESLPIEDDPFLLLSRPVHMGDRTYVVHVAAGLDAVEESVDALTGALWLGLPPLIIFVAAGSWLLVGSSLAPVEAMRREVESIGRETLDRRVAEPPPRDEIGRLALTMNGMLDRLQQASEEQERFVADAAHELRSPLASLRVQMETAEGDADPHLLAEVIRLQRLTEDLLLLAGRGRDVPGTTLLDFDAVVQQMVAGLADTTIEIDTSGVEPAQVRGDAGQLSRLVRNLLENAERHARSRIILTLHEEGHEVILTVADDGPGIPPLERERVFERFVRLDIARTREAGGTGLGLSIVRSITEAHGGQVSLGESSMGGTLATVRLPSASGRLHPSRGL